MGLYGIGGIGKTTACKALCNYLFEKFQNKVCHIEFHNGSEWEFLGILHTMIKKFTNITDDVLTKFNDGEVCKLSSIACCFF